MKDEMMYIDDLPVLIRGEKNLLELIRHTGIELPTFCYYSELSVYGACRMCMVENEKGGMEAACSTPPRPGMRIYTNTPRLRKHRKMILELLLADHCRDCTTCPKNGSCKLQELARRFGIRDVRFPNTKPAPEEDKSSPSIVIDRSKCILCGDCVRMCHEIQNVGAIDFAYRGAKMIISPAFGDPISQTDCVGCGQCAAVCPTGAITVKNDIRAIWRALADKNTRVLVQIAPAVRVGIGRELGAREGENVMGKIIAALRRMGFAQVYDTTVGADLTVVEEAEEFLQRLERGEALPLFTSCCPAWVRYAEEKHPELLGNLSSCRSPMEMFGAVLKEYYADDDRRTVMVAVMPCTAKKAEALRPEFIRGGVPDVDHVLTTKGLIQMIREAGIDFSQVEPEGPSMPFGSTTGAGTLFGVSGGVTEAVLRHLSEDRSIPALRAISFQNVRGSEGLRETTVEWRGRTLRIAMVSGLANAETLIRRIRGGEVHYDFVEVMACPSGCIAGGGQPFSTREEKRKRAGGLYESDRMSIIKLAEEDPVLESLYAGVLKGRRHELLHVERRAGNETQP